VCCDLVKRIFNSWGIWEGGGVDFIQLNPSDDLRRRSWRRRW
jgi:hypothetical protein